MYYKSENKNLHSILTAAQDRDVNPLMPGGNKRSYILKHVSVCLAFCYPEALNGQVISAQVRTLVTHIIISFDHRLNR